VEKNEKKNVLAKLSDCISTTSSFDLWMSKGGHDIFDLVNNFLGFNWQFKQMIIGLFEVTKTTNQTMTNNLTKCLIMDWEKIKLHMSKMRGQI
jgi:hypothetical protein